MQSFQLIINVVNIVIIDLCTADIRAYHDPNGRCRKYVRCTRIFFFFNVRGLIRQIGDTSHRVVSLLQRLIIDTRDSFFLFTYFKTIACIVTLGDCSGPVKPDLH